MGKSTLSPHSYSIQQTTDAKLDIDPEKNYLGKLCRYGHEWHDTGKSLRRHHNHDCVECHRERDRERNRRGDGVRKYAVRIEITNNIKLERGCADCGYNAHPAALHFDHLPGAEKRWQIARRVMNAPLADLLDEIDKCEVVCANCHAVRTAERGQHGNPRHKALRRNMEAS